MVDPDDPLEIRVTIRNDAGTWKLRLHWSVDEAAEQSASEQTIGASLEAFDVATLTLNTDTAGATDGRAHHLAHKFVGGVKTMAEMRNIFPEAV
jgi:hypothetical protein